MKLWTVGAKLKGKTGFRDKEKKIKLEVFSTGYPVALVTYYVKKMTITCSR